MNPILEFRRVCLATGPAQESGLADLSFALEPGGLALLELDQGQADHPLADLASGLLDPESGEVLFDGVPWLQRSADEAGARRGQIGRVFHVPGWVSNLDVDENVTLFARYHRMLPEGEAYAQAQELAQRLGLSGLPAGRPAQVARPDLRRAEWVRALLGERRLVILERPLHDLPPAWGEPLLAEVERQRVRGVAFLWMQGPGLAVDRLKPTLQFKVESGNIIRN